MAKNLIIQIFLALFSENIFRGENGDVGGIGDRR